MENENKQLAIEISALTGITINNYAGMEALLIAYINDLIANDFNRLLNLLYRVDVNEQKLKTMLRENPETDPGKLITIMLIERQLEKIRSRNDSQNEKSPGDSEEETW